ncbi:hypothetical protein LEBR102806_11810 [Levilactobacillus brevis]|uniref:Uncharacterized protein n=1 Tax=Levilactobacillus brevis ATCC 14869 = DSM 20054 TaxID=649758 RepID=U2R1N2_LEVBR|nr:hypothetical protein [Levilactobacillus brevis]ERK44582.1 hypothetical protein HMPREF0495_00790 [Levilactobacillus brevis ATCC 14869 = DSM 20054]KRK21391.1 hypothetical protein FC61_GL000036 [Levilactobacillus brevis ATCC 14869 = DSM 20054]MCT3573098.1 hypothetical protein [Levilactobacillus brevis]SQG81312.1 Uncharacterised protein [Levilactobacillus brevis]
MKLSKLAEVAAKFNGYIVHDKKKKTIVVTDQRGVMHAQIKDDYKGVYLIQAWADSPFPTELAIAVAEFAGSHPLFRMDMNV